MSISHSNATAITAYAGQNMIVTCNDGYVATTGQGHIDVMCSPGGQWIHQERCESKDSDLSARDYHVNNNLYSHLKFWI